MIRKKLSNTQVSEHKQPASESKYKMQDQVKMLKQISLKEVLQYEMMIREINSIKV